MWLRAALWGSVAFVLLAAASTAAQTETQAEHPKPGPFYNVLLLNSYDRGNSYTELQEQAIREVIGDPANPFIASVFIEYLSLPTYSPDSEQRLVDLILERHVSDRFNLIITTDTPALQFVLAHDDEIFPHVPLVFSAAVSPPPELSGAKREITGVVESIDFAGALRMIQRLCPARTTVLAVTGTAEYGRTLERRLEEAAATTPGIHVRWSSAVWFGDLLSEVKQLGPDTAVLFCGHDRVRHGRLMKGESQLQKVCAESTAPVFTLFDIFLGDGVVGGQLTSGEYLGRTAAQLAVRILSGEKASQIPIVDEHTTVPMFDARALERWHISEMRLPEGSVVRFRPQSFLEVYKWYLVGGATVVGAQSITIALLALHRARLKRSQRALRRSEGRYTLASSAAAVFVWEWRIESDKTYFDGNLLEYLGYADSMPPTTASAWLKMIHAEDFARGTAAARRHAEGREPRFETEFRFIRADGTHRWFLARGQAIPMGAGRAQRIVGTIVDIHERKMAEDALRLARAELEHRVATRTTQLRESEERLHQQSLALAHVSRVAMVGEMAAGIAHEINQPLTAALNHAEAASLAIRNPGGATAELASDLQAIVEQIGRIDQIIRNMRVFVSNRDEARSTRSLEPVLQDVGRLLDIELRRSDVTLAIEIEPALPPALVNEVQIQQVIVNLVRNAIDACVDCPPERRHVELSARVAPGDLIEVTVSDAGRGVPSGIRARIFDPFFTTRSAGLGMGLSISRTIVERHGGRLWFTDREPWGTAFHFTVPGIRGTAEP